VDGFRDRITGVTAAGTITADETVPMAGTLGIGYVLWMSQRWTFQGLGLGNLVYSLPLAPGEQQLIAIYERVDTATVQESEFFTEEETEVQSARADTSTHATFNSGAASAPRRTRRAGRRGAASPSGYSRPAAVAAAAARPPADRRHSGFRASGTPRSRPPRRRTRPPRTRPRPGAAPCTPA